MSNITYQSKFNNINIKNQNNDNNLNNKINNHNNTELKRQRVTFPSFIFTKDHLSLCWFQQF